MNENDTQNVPRYGSEATPPHTEPHETEADGTSSAPFASRTEPEPHQPEPSRTVPEQNERTPHHTVLVKHAVRMFENAGVPRAERSVTKWCNTPSYENPNETRLDCFYDERTRRYFITPASIERTIKEEQEKTNPLPFGTEPHAYVAGTEQDPKRTDQIPHYAERQRNGTPPEPNTTAYDEKITELQRKLRDAEIASRAKDQVIEHLKEQGKDISAHFAEQMTRQARALSTSFQADLKQLGRLEERLQLGAGTGEPVTSTNHTNPNDEGGEEAADYGG